jgi:hypothetical protein
MKNALPRLTSQRRRGIPCSRSDGANLTPRQERVRLRSCLRWAPSRWRPRIQPHTSKQRKQDARAQMHTNGRYPRTCRPRSCQGPAWGPAASRCGQRPLRPHRPADAKEEGRPPGRRGVSESRWRKPLCKCTFRQRDPPQRFTLRRESDARRAPTRAGTAQGWDALGGSSDGSCQAAR